jgi:hypothetical protein
MLDIDAKFRIKQIQNELNESDKIIIRFLEDLLVILIKKKILSNADVPGIVWQKFVDRQKLRKELKELKAHLVLEPVIISINSSNNNKT